MAINSATVKKLARQAGFDLVGITSAEAFLKERAVVLERLGRGLMGELAWYTEARVRRGTDPQAILPGARSIISLAVSYYTENPSSSAEDAEAALRGRVARYAWGRDYHNVLKKRCR